MNFKDDLCDLINKYSVENDSDTPDFILVQYINDSLKAYSNAVSARDRFFKYDQFVSNMEYLKETDLNEE